MAEEVKIKVTANTSQATSALSSLNKSWIGINSALDVAQKGAQMLGEAYAFLAGDTQAYAAQVRQMMRVSGQNAEMTSRMIQLTDDFALSEGSLEQAMKGASQKGIAFTVDNLAKLSDEYLKLAPGVERNTFLIDRFGRAGLEMAKIMERGSTAIIEQGAAQADNLIMTQANLDAAEELRIAEDNLNDSFQGLKYTIGNAVIPVLVDAANAFELLLTWHNRVQAAIKQNSQTMIAAQVPYAEYLRQMEKNVTAQGYVVKSTAEGVRIFRQVGPVLKEVDNTFGILSRSQYEAAKATDETTDALIANVGVVNEWEARILAAGETVINKNREAAASIRDDMAGALADAAAAADSWKSGAGGDLGRMLEDAGLSGQDLDAALVAIDQSMGTNLKTVRDQNTAMQNLVNKYKDTRDIDTFKQGLDDLSARFIPLQEAAVLARVRIQELYAALQAIDGQTATAYMNVISGSGGKTMTTPTYTPGVSPYYIPPGKASGGTANANTPYMVGERGPELFVPSTSGTVVPNNKMSGTTINNLYVTLPNVTNAQQFAAELGRMANNARNAGRGYQGA
ncbi:MAG: hypothetical protein WC710_14270 [Gallionella sp.]|jgi:hypothetical protein